MTHMTAHATVRGQGEGEKQWFSGGGLLTWKATSEETDGAFMMFEDDLEQGKVTPLHLHPEADETFYILEGEILLRVGGEKPRTLGAGGIAIIPRGVPHAFMVTSERARMLCLQNPGSPSEEFFRTASDPAVPGQPASPVDFERVIAAGATTGAMEILGPPPF